MVKVTTAEASTEEVINIKEIPTAARGDITGHTKKVTTINPTTAVVVDKGILTQGIMCSPTVEETATDKGTLTRATKIPAQRTKMIATVEATMVVDMVEITTAVEDKGIQSRATKAPARHTKTMTTVEEVATDKGIQSRATKTLARHTKTMITVDRAPARVQAHGNAARHVETDIRM